MTIQQENFHVFSSLENFSIVSYLICLPLWLFSFFFLTFFFFSLLIYLLIVKNLVLVLYFELQKMMSTINTITKSTDGGTTPPAAGNNMPGHTSYDSDNTFNLKSATNPNATFTVDIDNLNNNLKDLNLNMNLDLDLNSLLMQSTPYSSDYSLSNRSSIPDVSNTLWSNQSPVNESLSFSPSNNDDLVSVSTFTNWNSNYLDKDIQAPTSNYIPAQKSSMSPSKLNFSHRTNYQNNFSLNDPFLPSNLVNSLSNQSLMNNQFLNPQQQPQQAQYQRQNSITSPSTTHISSSNTPSLSSSTTSFADQLIQFENASSSLKTNKVLFKTELCDSYQKTGFCPYNSKCQFAHGVNELNLVSRNKKWKTKICKNWAKTGYCNYGKRCCYKHGEKDDGSNTVFLPPPTIVLKKQTEL